MQVSPAKREVAPAMPQEPSGLVVWVTGLPSAGKTTLALDVRRELIRRGHTCVLLDGDAIRDAIVPPHDHSPEGRDAFYATLARLSATLSEQGVIVLVAATAHQASYRERARSLTSGYVEVFVDTAPEECERRDAKGLYAAAKRGEVANLPGRDAEFEVPETPDVVAKGGLDKRAVDRILDIVARRTS